MIGLAGDVGGTKVWLQAFNYEFAQSQSERYKNSTSSAVSHKTLLAEARYEVKDFPSLEALIQAFQSQFQIPRFDAACLGLPAPIHRFPVALTNLDWQVDPETLKQSCHIAQLWLLNDFAAAAYGIAELNLSSEEDVVCLQRGEQATEKPLQNRLIIGAGTGLGVAPIVGSAEGDQPQSSEGGHMDFAPNTALQINFLQFLRERYSHVSYERVLSGKGLQNCYEFIQKNQNFSKNVQNSQSCFDESTMERPQPEQISAWAGTPDALPGDADAMARRSAHQAMTLFTEVYGAFVGSAGLLWPAKGGLFLAGGMAAKNLAWMQSDIFLRALHAKGRMQPLTEQWPVYVVKQEKLGVWGAAHYLLRQFRKTRWDK